ncbi:MAG: hypothetical protein ACRDSH_18790 [Pseudonocardiaceae bacterium]
MPVLGILRLPAAPRGVLRIAQQDDLDELGTNLVTQPLQGQHELKPTQELGTHDLMACE